MEEVLSSLFSTQNNIFMFCHLLIKQSSLKFDELAISVKLSNDVRFEGLKVYFPKIKDWIETSCKHKGLNVYFSLNIKEW